MSTKNPFFVSPPTDYQQFGSGNFIIYHAGSGVKISLDGGNSWQTLPDHFRLPYAGVSYYIDTDLNDIEKSIAIPVGEIWSIISVRIHLTPTATAGTRKLYYGITNLSGSQSMVERDLPVTTSASTLLNYSLYAGAPESSSATNNRCSAPLPTNLLMPGTSSFNIAELSSTDSNDDMRIYVQYKKYTSLDLLSTKVNASDLLLSWSESLVTGSEQKVNVFKIG